MTITANGGTLTASYVYSGLSDYFGGYGCIDNDDRKEFLLYASYGRKTSLADIVDELVSDSWDGGEELPDDVTDSDVRDAIMTTALNTYGRMDIVNGALARCSADYGTDAECACGASLTDVDDGDPCPVCDDWHNDQGERPIFVVVLEYECPSDNEDTENCVGCCCYPCRCLPNDCNCDPE